MYFSVTAGIALLKTTRVTLSLHKKYIANTSLIIYSIQNNQNKKRKERQKDRKTRNSFLSY